MRPLQEYKEIINDSLFEIPQRMKEYDPSFFIVRNHLSKKYEVHSTDNIWDSFCFTVPFEELDCRVIEIAMKNDTKKKSARDFEREMDAHNQRIEKRKEKEFKNWANDVARETYSHWKKDLDHEYIGMPKKVIQ